MSRTLPVVIPATEGELREALENGRLQEGNQLDLKREIVPGDRANRALAIDLASLAPAGGTILVGVTDDRPPAPAPVQLEGLRERVEQVARSAIDPPLGVQVREIPSADSRGYLVIEVPPSLDAPHAVDGVFRGRAGSTNVRLSAAEVRRFHGAASEQRVPPILDVLREFIGRDPTPAEQRQLAHLFIVARPRDGAREMLQDAVGDRWEAWTQDEILRSVPRLTAEWSPDVREGLRLGRVPDGWVATTFERPHRVGERFYEPGCLELDFGEEGSVRLFCSRGSDHYKEAMVVLELLVGGLVHRVAHAAARVAGVTGYAGTWDFAVGLVGVADAVSYFRLNNWWIDADDLPAYPESEYVRDASFSTADVRDRPDLVVDRLVGPLNRALNEGRAPLPTVRT